MTVICHPVGVAGRFKITADQRTEDGSVISGTERVVADWFPNLITDNGLELMKSNGFIRACQVGSGSAAPANSDTALVARVAGVSYSGRDRGPSSNVSPRYASALMTYEFGQGEAAGNLSEVGISNTPTSSLFSRALILDGNGNPTTITVLPIEFLTVTYEWRVYLDDALTPGTIVVDGVTHDTVTTGGVFHTDVALGWDSAGPGTDSRGSCYSGQFGAPGADPQGAGSVGGGDSVTSSVAPAGEYYKDFTFAFSIDKANYPGGVTAFQYPSGPWSGVMTFATKVSFNPPLPKDKTKTMSITMRKSWGRYVAP